MESMTHESDRIAEARNLIARLGGISAGTAAVAEPHEDTPAWMR